MKRLEIASAKLAVVFPEGKLPAIDPADPAFVLLLGTREVHGKVNPKAARKLAQQRGGAVLQGKLVAQAGTLNLLDAGFTWIDPKAQAATDGGATSARQEQPRNDTRPQQDPAPDRTAWLQPQELVDIAAETARCAGLDVTITPYPEVVIQIGDPPQLLRCSGVRFDEHYLLVRLPTGSWRALKIDPATGSVVLRLACPGGYWRHVVRILTALVYDRLKARRDQFEARIAVLPPPADPVEVRSVPEPPVFPLLEPRRRWPPDASPWLAAEAPLPASPPDLVSAAAPSPAAGPEASTESTPSPEPTAPAAPAPAPRPAKSAGPPAAPGGNARPLTGRVRR
jgi:hypothetical protein